MTLDCLIILSLLWSSLIPLSHPMGLLVPPAIPLSCFSLGPLLLCLEYSYATRSRVYSVILTSLGFYGNSSFSVMSVLAALSDIAMYDHVFQLPLLLLNLFPFSILCYFLYLFYFVAIKNTMKLSTLCLMSPVCHLNASIKNVEATSYFFFF